MEVSRSLIPLLCLLLLSSFSWAQITSCGTYEESHRTYTVDADIAFAPDEDSFCLQFTGDNVVVEGNNHTISCATCIFSDNLIFIGSGAHVEIRDLQLTGHPSSISGTGIRCISHCHLTITGCTIATCDQAVYVDNPGDLAISGNTFINNHAGLQLGQFGQSESAIIASANTFKMGKSGTAMFIKSQGDVVITSSNVVATIYGNDRDYVTIVAANIHVEGVSINTRSGTNGFNLQPKDSAIVRGNSFQGTVTQSAFVVQRGQGGQHAPYLELSGNTISSATCKNGIIVKDIPASINGNVISQNKFYQSAINCSVSGGECLVFANTISSSDSSQVYISAGANKQGSLRNKVVRSGNSTTGSTATSSATATSTTGDLTSTSTTTSNSTTNSSTLTTGGAPVTTAGTLTTGVTSATTGSITSTTSSTSSTSSTGSKSSTSTSSSSSTSSTTGTSDTSGGIPATTSTITSTTSTTTTSGSTMSSTSKNSTSSTLTSGSSSTTSGGFNGTSSTITGGSTGSTLTSGSSTTSTSTSNSTISTLTSSTTSSTSSTTSATSSTTSATSSTTSTTSSTTSATSSTSDTSSTTSATSSTASATLSITSSEATSTSGATSSTSSSPASTSSSTSSTTSSASSSTSPSTSSTTSASSSTTAASASSSTTAASASSSTTGNGASSTSSSGTTKPPTSSSSGTTKPPTSSSSSSSASGSTGKTSTSSPAPTASGVSTTTASASSSIAATSSGSTTGSEPEKSTILGLLLVLNGDPDLFDLDAMILKLHSLLRDPALITAFIIRSKRAVENFSVNVTITYPPTTVASVEALSTDVSNAIASPTFASSLNVTVVSSDISVLQIPSTSSSSESSSSSEKPNLALALGVGLGLGLPIILVAVVLWYRRSSKRHQRIHDHGVAMQRLD